VRRTSEIRTTVDLNIAGKGIKLPALPEDRAQAGGIPECEAQTFVLRDFAPGRGVVTITARIGDKSIDLGSFDFLVNRLYHGMLSFGPIASRAKGIRYNVVDRNGTSVIEEETAASDWVKGYAIFYTAFLHGRRDFEKPLPKKLGARVHPTVGFLLESSKRNALVGLSLEGPTILVTVGLHMTEGQRLLGQPGLAVGSPFSRPAVELPTRRVVDSGLFLSLNLDLRAAAALISAITQVGS